MLHSVAGVGLHCVAGHSARVAGSPPPLPEHHPAVRVVVVCHGGAQGRSEVAMLLVIVPASTPGRGGIVAILATRLNGSNAQRMDSLNA